MPKQFVEVNIPDNRVCCHCELDRGVTSKGGVRPVCQSCGTRCDTTEGFDPIEIDMGKIKANAEKACMGDPDDKHKFAQSN